MISSSQHKLSPKYYGPFLVLKKVGNVAYRLDFPASSLVQPTFHVSLLKKAHGNTHTVSHLPSVEGVDSSLF